MPDSSKSDPARYGHIAVAIRHLLKENKWSVGDFSEKIGLPRGSTTPYVWRAARGAPNDYLRTKLVRAFPQIPVATWYRRDEVKPKKKGKSIMDGNAEMLRAVGSTAMPASRDVLMVTVNTQGVWRIKFDMELPALEASQLIRLMLEQGLIPNTQKKNEGE